MKWIYLSPHLDDAIYSCGGLIHKQVQSGIDVEIWTIFAGQFQADQLTPFAEAIHQRWGTGLESISARLLEDKAACEVVGAKPRIFDFQDVIYRINPISTQPEIIENEDLFRPWAASDAALQNQILSVLQQALSGQADFQLCVPLGLGGHIDHTLVRQASEALKISSPLMYYADFPYVVRSEARVEMGGQERIAIAEQDVTAWCRAIALYASQVSTFWMDQEQMCQEIRQYWENGGGSYLWFNDQ